MSKKIMLVDGNSIVNRAYYALPLLKNKDGLFTNAIYGFFNMFFKLLEEEEPSYVAIAFDLPKPTFRHLKYSDYKGTRKRMPEELREQIPVLKDILTKMNIKIYEKEKFEADDILGTIAKRAEEKDFLPIIVTGDKDLLQIASNNIKIKIPKTKSGKTEVENYYYEDVVQKYGVSPTQFIDVKALMGDTSDNVPGVVGIGEKTALNIIKEYDTLENAIANAQNIKPKKASENLQIYTSQALLSKELVTIETNIPIDFNEEETLINDMFNSDVLEKFKELELKSLMYKFNEDEVYTKNDFQFELIDTIDKAESLLEKFNLFKDKEIFYQLFIEDLKLFSIVFSLIINKDIKTFIVKLEEKQLLEIFKPFFEGDYNKVGYEIKSDIVFLNKFNIEIKNVTFDTMLAAYILDSTKGRYSYSDIASEFLRETYPTKEEIFGRGKDKKSFSQIEKEKLFNYFFRSSNVLFRAKKVMQEKIVEKKQEELYYKIELPLTYVLASMEIIGIKVKKESIIEYKQNLEKKIQVLVKEIYWLAQEKFNINSPKQLEVILFEKIGLKGGKKTKTGYSTSAEVLEKLKNKHEIVNKVLNYRTFTKLNSTYAEGLLNLINKDTGRIHSNFNQTVTTTGRISSTDPNLQNIPIKIDIGRSLRKVFIPENEDFIFIDADYSQIELRVLAHLSKDENLIEAFNKGDDIHTITASKIFNIPVDKINSFQRGAAKAINFGLIYGKQAFTLSQDLGITKKQAEDYINEYFSKYPKVKIFLENCIEDAKNLGYSKTFFNRIRYIPEINSTNFLKKSSAERIAMNMPIQGAAADIIKLAMVKVFNKIKNYNLKSRLILQVHDELLIEAFKKEEKIIYEILNDEMKNVMNFSVPLDIDINSGKNWYEVK